MQDPLVERRFVVVGAVQGVGYRWFVRDRARALGVDGWVRNMPDGSVVLEVAASAATLARFAAELEAGPPAAEVHEVRVTDRAGADPLPDGFIIVR